MHLRSFDQLRRVCRAFQETRIFSILYCLCDQIARYVACELNPLPRLRDSAWRIFLQGMSIFVGYSLGELSSVPAEDHRYGEHKRLSLQMERSVLRRFENDFPRLGLLLRRRR